ncbi:MAG TPA: MFS transporter [Candidatus Didemnitutus sp.]|nr:MFS transporter [Candidatus Didemnitutus sp.]
MRVLLRDTRVQRLLLANITGSVGSGVTIIAVPWLLIHRPNGDQLYGWATIGTTLALFLFMPHYGTWLDRHSRKTMLLAGELFGFIATAAMALWALGSGRLETWQLLTSYFCGMLYYTLHYPAKYAFLQQIIDRRHYQSLTGLMEVQGQAASMLAGGLAGVMIDRAPLWLILLIDASTYLFSFFVQSTLPYQPTHLQAAGGAPPSTDAWRGMMVGWQWLRAHARISIFFGCTLVPFVLVMVSNYLFPVYVTDVLHASATVFGNGEIVFAIGALFAGMFVPQLANARGAENTILFTMSFCLAALALLMFWPTPLAYYVALGLFGVGNAGSRVTRNGVMLHVVPNSVMGRVTMFYSAADRLLRTVLTSLATLLVAHGNATFGFAMFLLVLLAAFIGTLATRASIRSVAVGAPA